MENKRPIESISVVIAKPTKLCNADCTYCSSPPDGSGKWSFGDFKLYFDKLLPWMISGAHWIWHGGEPMLMGSDYYKKCHDYATAEMDKVGKKIFFSMQTNILSYDSRKWFKVFDDIFGGRISTSYDPDEKFRTIKGNPVIYSRIFKEKLDNIISDGFFPLVISVFSEDNAHLMHKMYDWANSYKDGGFNIRLNYCHPSGRFDGVGEAIKPSTYGKLLIEIYNKWIKELPQFTVTPLDQMFKKTMGEDGLGHCPWLKGCGGRFLSIDPNGDIFNCSEFADIGNEYRYGNLARDDVYSLLSSKPAILIKRRQTLLPPSCQSCEHFAECEGGCMRDSLLFQKGLYGKFHYCESWKMVFKRIKESISNGEADGAIAKYGFDAERVRHEVLANMAR